MTYRQSGSSFHKAFSLVELLLVLAIISIMAALVINSFSNAAQDSRNVMARQQQENMALKKAMRPAAIASLSNSNDPFKTGARVSHVKFGQGTVLGKAGDQLTIQFDDVGLKKIMIFGEDSFFQF